MCNIGCNRKCTACQNGAKLHCLLHTMHANFTAVLNTALKPVTRDFSDLWGYLHKYWYDIPIQDYNCLYNGQSKLTF